MQSKSLETFLSVAETGGFHSAARKLNVTQTAVSARIRALEDATGKPLFSRGAGGTVLTEYGRQFKPYAEQMLSLWSFAANDLPEQIQNRLALRLGAQLSVWDPLLVDLAVRFEQRFGQLLLTLNYDHDLDMVDAVATHVLDAALTHEKPADRRVVFHELAPERLSLVQSSKDANTDAERVFVNIELGETYRDHVRSTARLATGQTIFLGNCLMALRYLLQRGGYGYFPDYVITQHLNSGELLREKDARDLMLPLYLVVRSDSQEVENILQCLEELRR